MRRRGPKLAALVAALAACRPPAPLRLAELVAHARAGETISLPAGHFRASLAVDRPVTIRGAGEDRTVLEGTVTLEAEGARLADLTVAGEGDGTALLLRASAAVEHVRVTNERGEVVKVLAGRRLDARGLEVECVGRSKAAGLVVLGDAVMSELTVRGACRRGLDVAGGRVRIDGGVVEGPWQTGARALDGELDADGLHVTMRDDDSVGLFAARSRLDVRRSFVSGGAQGVLVRSGTTRLEALDVRGSEDAAVGFVQADATISRATFAGPFAHAAVVATDSPRIELDRTTVDRAGRAGLLAVRSHVVANDVTVGGARVDSQGDFGHGFALENSTAELARVRVVDADGGLVWASDSKVRVDGASGEHVLFGFASTLGAEVEVRRASLDGAEVGVVALLNSRLAIDASPLDARFERVACDGSRIEVAGRPGASVGCSAAGLPKAFRQPDR